MYLSHWLKSHHSAVVIACYERNGCTLVYDAAVSAARKTQPKGRRSHVQRPAWELADTEPKPGHVYKTHDYPQVLIGQSNMRNLFMLDSVLDAALSMIGGLPNCLLARYFERNHA